MYVTYKNMVDPANPNDPNVRVIDDPKDDDLTPAMLLWGMMAVNGFTYSNDRKLGFQDPDVQKRMADATGLSPYAVGKFASMALSQENKPHFTALSDAFQAFASGGNGTGYQGSSCPDSVNPFQTLASGLRKPHSVVSRNASGGVVLP